MSWGQGRQRCINRATGRCHSGDSDEGWAILQTPQTRIGGGGSADLAINLSVPREAMEPLEIELLAGHSLFVLGANGSGKSSLMHRFNSNRVAPTRWISAHRQTWFESGIVNITPYNKDTL